MAQRRNEAAGKTGCEAREGGARSRHPRRLSSPTTHTHTTVASPGHMKSSS